MVRFGDEAGPLTRAIGTGWLERHEVIPVGAQGLGQVRWACVDATMPARGGLMVTMHGVPCREFLAMGPWRMDPIHAGAPTGPRRRWLRVSSDRVLPCRSRAVGLMVGWPSG